MNKITTAEQLIIFSRYLDQQVVIKSLDTHFRQIPGVAGATIHGDGTECFMELATQFDVGGSQRYVLTTIDHFTLAPDGRFSRMIVYVRPS